MMVAAGLIAAVAAPSSAATPANQACVGESLSALASNQPSNGSFGAAVKGFAQAPNTPHPGLGDAIQLFQAGGSPTRWYRTPATTDAFFAALGILIPLCVPGS